MLKSYTFIFVDYDYNKCIKGISRWLQANVTEISAGNIILRSIHLDSFNNEDKYFPKKWQLDIEYDEKI